MVFRVWIWIILVAALVIRIAAAIWWQANAGPDDPFRFGDSHSYWELATRIAHGQSYQYGSADGSIFRAPLYPIWLAPWTLIEDHRLGVFWARVAGCGLGTVCVALVMLAARRVSDRGSTLIAGGLAACYPGAIGMSVFVLSESIFCPLMLLGLYAWSVAEERFKGEDSTGFIARTPPESILLRPQVAWCIASGIATGLACLSRPSWFLWPIWLAFFSLLFSRCRTRQLVVLSVFGLGIVTAMSPWWVRNYLVTGKFVPTTLQVGASLYDGWHPGASGASDEDMQFVNPFAAQQREADRASNSPLESTYEYRLNQRILRAALVWAQENPSDVLSLGVIKLLKTWNPWPTAEQIGSAWIRLAEAVGYVVILICGIIGWWRVRHVGWAVHVYAHPCLYFGCLHVIFIGSVRYRQPAILVLCVLAGVGLSWLLDLKGKTISNRSC